jgi:predicted AlkP superfamily pyrophosphatase or phosphodiesterase
LGFVCLKIAAKPALAQKKPRLILQITVDQLRGDLPTRYYDNLGDGGLRYLVDQGIHFVDAHHCHANTETIVGHATLATGAHPSAHGMVGNVWYDKVLQREVYNIEDADSPLLDEGAGIDADTEIDPTQKAAGTDGRSPSTFLVTTFSDELRAKNAGQSKVFSVSVKDRGAVSLAGQTGKAFWFSKSNNRFVTSTYYYDAYPDWVNAWNDQRLAYAYARTDWELLHPSETYLFADRDDQKWETNLGGFTGGFGITFPHAYDTPLNPLFSTFLTISPAGDELTTDFAKALINAEQLGQDSVPDYLAISYSSTDYVGHIFGPSSLESEDTIYRLDRTLADLFAFIDDRIGLDQTLIVLSGDHGASEAPGYLESVGIRTDYVSPDTWDTTAPIARLKKRFGIKGELLAGYSHPYLNIAPEVLENPEIDIAELETAIAEELVAYPDVAYAIPSTAVATNQLPDTAIMNLIRNNYHPARSGNIYVVFQPGWFINDFDGLSVTSTHGSPWRSDTHVPIIFAGYGLERQKVARRICTTAIASTLSAVIGTARPNGATGVVLQELVSNHR